MFLQVIRVRFKYISTAPEIPDDLCLYTDITLHGELMGSRQIERFLHFYAET